MKFHTLLSNSGKDRLSIYMKAASGFLKVEYRNSWEDGLGNGVLIRVINPSMGMSSAPTTWAHLLKLLELNGVTENDLDVVLNSKLQVLIVGKGRDLEKLRAVMGDEYVDKILEESKGGSFVSDIARLFNKLIKPTKPKFTVMQGGKNET